MNLIDGEGIVFYEFLDILDEKVFKNNYCQVMNDLFIDQVIVSRIVDEVNVVFGMNMKMFNELEGNLIKVIGILLFNILIRKCMVGSIELVIVVE